MTHAFVRAGALTLLACIAVACASGAAPSPSARSSSSSAAQSPTVEPSPSPALITFNDFSDAFCGAFTSLIRAYGNPDANSQSQMRKALDDAVSSRDVAAAMVASTAMLNELEAGRRFAAVAGRWQPGAATAASMDRLLLAFEAWTSARLALVSNPTAIDPQTAFERAGGVEAWAATLQGVGTVPVPPGASPTPCRAFSGQI